MKILDVGCGTNKAEGAIGIDIRADSAGDVIHDLDLFPYPFPDNEFDLILCNHIVEHIFDVVAFFEELHRIARNGAKITGVTPHFSNPHAFGDPTHRHYFSYHFLDFFTDFSRRPMGKVMRGLNRLLQFDVFYNFSLTPRARFRILERGISFPRFWRGLGIAWLANRYPDLYETYLSGIARSRDIHFTLEIIKGT